MRRPSPNPSPRTGRPERLPPPLACPCNRRHPPRSTARPASPDFELADGVDEGLIGLGVSARRHGLRLSASLLGEPGGARVGYPDLQRPQPLFTQSGAMPANLVRGSFRTLGSACHEPLHCRLHVTYSAGRRNASSQRAFRTLYIAQLTPPLPPPPPSSSRRWRAWRGWARRSGWCASAGLDGAPAPPAGARSPRRPRRSRC